MWGSRGASFPTTPTGDAKMPVQSGLLMCKERPEAHESRRSDDQALHKRVFRDSRSMKYRDELNRGGTSQSCIKDGPEICLRPTCWQKALTVKEGASQWRSMLGNWRRSYCSLQMAMRRGGSSARQSRSWREEGGLPNCGRFCRRSYTTSFWCAIRALPKFSWPNGKGWLRRCSRDSFSTRGSG